jgi:hypothetical protein
VRSKEWKRKVWIFAVAVVLLCVVNPEVRALIFLVDALSLEVFLLLVGLQVKEFWLFVQPTLIKRFASLTQPSAAAFRHLSVAVNALSPRVPMALLAQQTLWAARIQLSAGTCRTCGGKAV